MQTVISVVISNLSGFVNKRGQNLEGAVGHPVLENVGAVVVQRNNTQSIRQLHVL